MEPHAARELAVQFRDLGDYIDAGGDPPGALDRIVRLARDSIEGCDWAAVTEAGAKTRTLAASDDVARAVDAIQTEYGEGPCLSASRLEAIVHAPDLSSEQRWPVFARRTLTDTPVRAVVAFELVTEGPRSTLNLYAGRPHAFDDTSLSAAALFAPHAQLAMLHLNAAAKRTNLEQALTTSRQIGTAMGILMAARKITEDQAFALLRSSSQNLHRKLRDVASDVNETGTLP